MKIEEIQNQWKEDNKIDDVRLDTESLKQPQLHSKYLNILNAEKSALNILKRDLELLVIDLYYYYDDNKLPQEKLKERGWLPNPHKILKSERNFHIEHHEEYINLATKINHQKDKVSAIESIMKEINSRNFHIKNAIEFRKFQNGLN